MIDINLKKVLKTIGATEDGMPELLMEVGDLDPTNLPPISDLSERVKDVSLLGNKAASILAEELDVAYLSLLSDKAEEIKKPIMKFTLLA